MMKYVSVSEMRAVEQEADRLGLTYAQMMENAGINLGRIVDREFRDRTSRTAMGLIGSGNNGGDTLVALAYLAEQGWKVIAYLVKERSADDPLVQRLLNRNGILISSQEDKDYQLLKVVLQQSEVLLDGVLGTGFELPLKESIGRVLKNVKEFVKHVPIHVIAVDCPSGVDCDSGQAAEEAIPAEITVTMAAIKAGLLKFPAYALCGRILVADIGLSDRFPTWSGIRRMVVDAEWVREILPSRSDNSHKGTFGTTLILAGSESFTGAAYLAAKAAYLGGCGLVTLGVVRSVYQALAGQIPEATWLILPEEQGYLSASGDQILSERLNSFDALVLGPGFGLHESTSGLVKRILDFGRDRIPPLVVDADGLKLLTKCEQWFKKIPPQTVLTPHPGEMSVLSGLRVTDVQSDRVQVAENFANQWGQIVVLKGAFTVIADPDGRTAINPVATSALARAGSGDVLAGLIGGLRAQGMNGFEGAVAGVWIHAQAGLRAAEKLGTTRCVLAPDLLEAIVDVYRDLGR